MANNDLTVPQSIHPHDNASVLSNLYGPTVTPPGSNSPSPNPDPPLAEKAPVISVSTVFYPGAHSLPSNLVFSSSDSVLFYVHTHILTEISQNAFRNLLPVLPPFSTNRVSKIVDIPEPSPVLDAILHIIYKLPRASQLPPCPTLISAVDQMPLYSISPTAHLVPANPSHALLLFFAPRFPLEVYALAAHFEIPDLAAAASAHLLAYPLSTIDDATAERMGPVYLKRLLCLHSGRFEALKGILLVPPQSHVPTGECGIAKQKVLVRVWTFAAAQLVWEGRSDISANVIQASFKTLDEDISCRLCLDALAARLKGVIASWACVSRTI